MPSIGIAGIFTIIRLDNPNLQKMKFPTQLSSQKLICSPVQIFERLGRERTGKGQRGGGRALFVCIFWLTISENSHRVFVPLSFNKEVVIFIFFFLRKIFSFFSKHPVAINLVKQY